MKELSINERVQAYNKAIKEAYIAYKNEDRHLKSTLERIFPELKESNDEKMRNFIINELVCLRATDEKGSDRYEELTNAIAWLETQAKQEQLYIRFGEIPTDEKSKIYRGEIEVGIENGVSVYPAFKTNEGDIVLGLNLPITKTTLHTQQHLIEYDNRPCYLVKGDYIGKDIDGQPLINNVSIIEKIDNYRVKEKIGNLDNQNYIKPTNMNKSKFMEGNLHEKQDEQKPCMIQWKGDNLKEVIDFTGKDKNFKKWFKSFEEYEKYVHEHNNIFKLFIENGNHYEIPVGAWIVKTPDGYNIASNAVLKQKSDDKIEPRFNVGDWVVFIKSKSVYQVEKKENYEYTLRHILGGSLCLSFSNENFIREWSIQDAKEGDVLEFEDHGRLVTGILSFVNKTTGKVDVSCLLEDNKFKIGNFYNLDTVKPHPATKEQSDLLFQKIQETGYRWVDETKTLEKLVEPKFQKGDWITIEKPCQIININDIKNYIVQYCDDEDENIHILSKNFCESHFHLWSIEDAQNGDVLYSPSHHIIWIYKDNKHYYACINMNYINENVNIDGLINIPNDVCPAAKNKQDILFAMMKKMGYEWDVNKKELIKENKMTHIIEPQERGDNGIIYTNSCEWCNRDTCEDCYDEDD